MPTLDHAQSEPSRSTDRGRFDHISNGLTALAVTVLQLGVAISLAALIFTGPLAGGAGRATTGFLLGTAIVSLVVGLGSRMVVVAAGAQDTAAIVLVAVAASITGSASGSTESTIATVVVMIALNALITGITFWLLAVRGWTSFVRYLPWPVITGFTAGTGWLLLRGGVDVMNGNTIHLSELSGVIEWSALQQILPGLALCLGIVAILRSSLSNTVVSAMIVAAAIIFHLVVWSVSSLDRAEAAGWLIGPFTQGSWRPIGPSDLGDTDWGLLASHAVPMAAVTAVAVVGLLLNLIGLETVLDSEIDIEHETKLSGIANIGVAFTGGQVGWHLIGDTALARRLGAHGRLVPLTVAGFGFAAVALGPDLVGLVPRLVAGGVLSGLGLNLLVDWFRITLPLLNRTDQFLSGAILIGIAVFGVLPGVGLGILISTAVFILRYSRIDPARHVIDAAGRSNVDRQPRESKALAASRGAILAVELQGFLFFGSTARLRSLLDERGIASGAGDTAPATAQGSEQTTRYLVIDMTRVTGVDSTAAVSIAALVLRLSGQNIVTVWSSLLAQVTDELSRNSVKLGPTFADLDHAIAWCEDQLLTDLIDGPRSQVVSLVRPELAALMEHRSLAKGDALIHVADNDQDLYFIEVGRLTAWVTSTAGRRTRLRQVAAGTVLGEVAFCRGGKRTADVIADTDSEILVLSREHFDQIAADQPHLAIEIQDVLLRRLANRLANTSAMVRDLLQ